MSLPAGQQRTLDGIAAALQASEPRLAAMFAMFARLCLAEPPPVRERLYRRPGLDLALAGRSRHRRSRPSWFSWRRLIFAGQFAVAAAVVVLLIVAFARVPGCPAPAQPRAAAATAAAQSASCPSSAGQEGASAGK